jgi:hypothetical protein
VRADHLFDRLAAPASRRQVLKAAIGGIVLALPFDLAAVAHADDGHDCLWGCEWFSFNKTDEAIAACQAPYKSCIAGFKSRVAPIPLLGGLSGPVAEAACGRALAARAARCGERALVEQKARQWDCLQPGCPGFDKDGPGGPCEPCNRVGAPCCPDPNVAQGYSCCAQCCSPTGKGCGSGTTDCKK